MMINAALAIFGPWIAVTVADIQKPVPEYVKQASYGAVTKEYRDKKSLPDECAIIEAGKIVGYRFVCRGK